MSNLSIGDCKLVVDEESIAKGGAFSLRFWEDAISGIPQSQGCFLMVSANEQSREEENDKQRGGRQNFHVMSVLSGAMTIHPSSNFIDLDQLHATVLPTSSLSEAIFRSSKAPVPSSVLPNSLSSLKTKNTGLAPSILNAFMTQPISILTK